jgi:hypothetical protein
MMNMADIPVGKPALKLGAREAVGFHHTPIGICHSELEHRLCKIDGNGSSIHVGLLLFDEPDLHANENQGATLAQKTGGVHPITQAARQSYATRAWLAVRGKFSQVWPWRRAVGAP